MPEQSSQSFRTVFEENCVSVTYEGMEIAFYREMMTFPAYEMTLIWNSNNEFHGMYNTSQERSNAQQYGRENQ